jgi:hypothetical protein
MSLTHSLYTEEGDDIVKVKNTEGIEWENGCEAPYSGKNSFTFNSSCSPAWLTTMSDSSNGRWPNCVANMNDSIPLTTRKEEAGMDKQALELAKRIIELDLERDAMFEQLIALVGSQADELLRFLQNR